MSYAEDLRKQILDYVKQYDTTDRIDVVDMIEYDFAHGGTHFKNLTLAHNELGNESLVLENLKEISSFIAHNSDCKDEFFKKVYDEAITALTNVYIAMTIYYRWITPLKQIREWSFEKGEEQSGENNTLPR